MMIFENFPLICSLAAIMFTQALKYPIAIFSKDKKTSLSIVTTTGGMPSSHSAAVSSLITALILQYGIGSGYVAIATTLASSSCSTRWESVARAANKGSSS